MRLTRWFFLTVVSLAGVARAHFPFVVPDAGGTTAKLVFSESLTPDDEVDILLAAGTKLTIRGGDGKDLPLTLTPGRHVLTLETPGAGTRVIRGIADLGVIQRGQGKAHHLVYHPKTILGDAFSAGVSADVPVELLPVGRPGAVQLELRIHGKPASDAEIAVLLPHGKEERVKTGPDGRTPAFADLGRYGAWARHWIDQPGQAGGKAYEQVRHYATLVFDTGDTAAAATRPTTVPAAVEVGPLRPVQTLATLPEGVASFGAIASQGHVYVYGGHTAPQHEYSTAAVSRRFHRAAITAPGKWEALPGGPGLQGMNLAAHGGKVYRVGGMQPRNAPGEPEDNVSIADAVVFDPAKGEWSPLPPLPTPRSSHDLIVLGDKLYAVGGWTMPGKDGEPAWIDSVAVLDLTDANAQWKSIPQPFKRRALAAAPVDERLFVVGGMDADENMVPAVDILDTRTGQWSKGPDLPGVKFNAFSPAACAIDGRLYVSVASGDLLRLSSDEQRWERIARTTPRIVHRLIPDGNRILILGGATRGKMLNLIEAVTVP